MGKSTEMSLWQRAKGNYYFVYLYRLAIAMALLFISRFAFFFLNKSLFPGITFSGWLTILRGGWMFDLAALFYFNCLFIILTAVPLSPKIRQSIKYQNIVKWIFYIFNGIALFLNSIDFIYFRFTQRRTTVSVFKEFSHEQNKASLAFNFVKDYWFVAVIFFALVAFMVWAYKRLKVQPVFIYKKTVYYTKATLVFLLSIALAIGGIRGDFKYSTRPITISNAGEFVSNPQEIYLVLNTPFCFVRTFGNKAMKPIHYFSDEEVEKIYSPVVHPADTTKAFEKKNVVIIILESFGKEAFGGYNKDLENGAYKGFTPFLDSLMGESKVYWNSFANGYKSIDALPSIIAGIPNGETPFVLTPYASNNINSLPKILNEEGYNTSFFHGAPNGSMGFKAFTQLMGIKNYYGKNEYNNDADFDGIWGIWDEPFFQYFARTQNTFKQPFFSTIFSVSSHHPFKVPAQYAGKFKTGPLPVLECIGYTDMALRKYFAAVSKSDWFKNTIFVISADHATVRYHPEYLNDWGGVAIPILLYAPGDPTFRGVDPGVIQQTDIMPTVLSYLHYNKPFVAFGENVLAKPRMNFAYNYNGQYFWFQDDYLLIFDGKQSKMLVNYKQDRLLKTNLLDKEKERAALMERNLKAYIQQYNNRIIGNKMTADK